MKTVELLAKLKKLVDECGKEEPSCDPMDIIAEICSDSKEMSDALAKAIRTLS